MSSENDAEYELALPFVTTTSQGGPHDDDAYVAGFEMGQLDVVLGFQWMQFHTAIIKKESVKQADLIAMHYDFKMEVEHEDGVEATVSFTRVCTCDPKPDDVENLG